MLTNFADGSWLSNLSIVILALLSRRGKGGKEGHAANFKVHRAGGSIVYAGETIEMKGLVDVSLFMLSSLLGTWHRKSSAASDCMNPSMRIHRENSGPLSHYAAVEINRSHYTIEASSESISSSFQESFSSLVY